MLYKAMQACDKVNQFFAGLPHSLEKIDILAVSMEPTARENWGLITLSLNWLTAGAQRSKLHDLNRADTALLRAMIHQWLSPLAIDWWDELWLKDGLTAYLASELATLFYPELSSELYALADTTISAMDDDDDPGKSHPIAGEKLKKA